MSEVGFSVKKIKPFKENASNKKYEFTARASENYILIEGKAGHLFGEHWHEGKVPSKSPEMHILIKGKVELYCRHVKSGNEQRGEFCAPAVFTIYPFWYHEMKALTDVIFIELGSVKEHLKDRKE